MLQVGTRLSGVNLTAQLHLQSALKQLAQSSERLATLKRINHGSDDPAGLIALEQLHAEITSLEKASEAADRNRALAHVADSGLDQATRLVNEIRGNLVTAADGTTSPQQKAALQLEVDAALEALDRIGGSTSIFGRDVLQGGELDVLVGGHPTELAKLNLPDVSSASLGDGSGSLADLRSGGVANLTGGDLARAAELLDAAQSQLLNSRAQLGAFERYTVDSTQAVLDSSIINLSEAASHIGDTDVAAESARLVRAQLLVNSSLSALGIRNGTLSLFDQLA